MIVQETHLIFPDQVRSAREGYVFGRVCYSVHGGPYCMMHWDRKKVFS